MNNFLTRFNFLLVVFFIIIIGCSGPEDAVKNGILDIDRTVTVGDALDNYKFFDKTEWKSFKDSQKRQIIEFNGHLNVISMVNVQGFGYSPITQEKFDAFKNNSPSTDFTVVFQFVVEKQTKAFHLINSTIFYNNSNEKVLHADVFYGTIIEKIYSNDILPAVAWNINDKATKIINEEIRKKLISNRSITSNNDNLNQKKDNTEQTQTSEITEQNNTSLSTSNTKPSIIIANNSSPQNQPTQITKKIYPSFDCSKAASPAEKLICSNAELSEADAELSNIYKQALSVAKDKNALVKAQNLWLKSNRNKCIDAKSMIESYSKRTEELLIFIEDLNGA